MEEHTRRDCETEGKGIKARELNVKISRYFCRTLYIRNIRNSLVFTNNKNRC